MLRKCFLLLALTMMTVQGAWAQRLSGSGTEESPYLISSESDWDFLAINFFGIDFNGKHYKLIADISVNRGKKQVIK